MNCTYRYPSRINDNDTEVERTFWFTKLSNNEPVDLRTDSEYSGRVQYHCDKNDCTLRITDLRESDSAEYKFMFITNQPGGRFTGSPGVTLTITDLQVQVMNSTSDPFRAELKCLSSCRLPDRSSYIWYKNGQEIWTGTSSSYSVGLNPAISFSCAVKGHEDFPSLPVCEFSSQSSTNITASCGVFYLKFCTMTSCISNMSDPTASLVIGTMFFSLSSTGPLLLSVSQQQYNLLCVTVATTSHRYRFKDCEDKDE
ncbi:uncharacterized protein LOC122976591 [Thunnus albacares]|uniref:uncharacterized protein LOC122976591 n=1 Tax=Thunnus albacares TaxID=8236 RepID=UPI001CF6E724|nr:uncharacterized protein LOC122976591 [Thunnus albacares]